MERFNYSDGPELTLVSFRKESKRQKQYYEHLDSPYYSRSRYTRTKVSKALA